MFLEAYFGPALCSLSDKYLVNKGYIVNPSVKMTKYKQTRVSRSDYEDSINYGIIYNESRNKKLTKIVDGLYRDGRKILVMVNRIEHGRVVSNYLRSEKIMCEFLQGKDSSDVRDWTKERFKKRNFVLIATKIFDEGVDIPEIDAVVIAGAGKDHNQFIQKIGRGRRLSEKDDLIVIDFYDESDEYLKSHSNSRLDLYEKMRDNNGWLLEIK